MKLFETEKTEKYLANPESSLLGKTVLSDQSTNHNRCQSDTATTAKRRCLRFSPKYILATVVLLCVVGERGLANGFEHRQELHVHHADSEFDGVRNLNGKTVRLNVQSPVGPDNKRNSHFLRIVFIQRHYHRLYQVQVLHRLLYRVNNHLIQSKILKIS